jgi:hypothetical protein
MNQTLTKLPLIRLKSFSGGGMVYTVDRLGWTCTCLQFATEGHCKHLDEVGSYQPKHFTPRTHPTFSQALSGLVKSIRLRRTEDALYWLTYLDGFPESEKLTRKAARFRVARRILIGSAEDGHSISVMEKVASSFRFLCRLDTPVVYLAAEVMRICKLPNWWNPSTGGHDYIYSNLVGYRQHVLYRKVNDPEAAKELLRRAVLGADRVTALGALCLLGPVGMGASRQAEFLMSIAQEMSHERAIRLLRIHLGARTALSGDNNFLGHAVWMLAGGVSPVADQIEPIVIGEVCELLKRARERWKQPLPIPSCYLDGVHSAGADRRYAGILQDMWAVCCCFSKNGNIEPANRWLPEFFPLTGLEIESAPQPIAVSAINCTPGGEQEVGTKAPQMQQTAHSVAFVETGESITNGLPASTK